MGYLGDWIRAQADDARAGKPGADLRLAAAQALQEKLKLILAGEPRGRPRRPDAVQGRTMWARAAKKGSKT